MKNVFKISALLLLMLVISCGNDDDTNCEDTIVNLTSIETEYGCTNTPYQLDVNLQDDFTILSSQDAFEALTESECNPLIDFETYDLIIGKQGLSNGFDSIVYQAVEDCNTNSVSLTVTFTLNATAEAPNVTYHVLVPKLINPQGTTVEIIIN
ncbi:hypothetical protein [Patiriisocius marinus]|uniref:Uncharacterized protein n=1 Tax=Patiriisocius marinus TaxID=1397112 RepID=A0A5J4IVB7_9FLAO|nr:hypothetical protein [Patiriisocius marinus]GER58784.1 hypothetical protein ULMA_08920 [Patiriisocius marinus]